MAQAQARHDADLICAALPPVIASPAHLWASTMGCSSSRSLSEGARARGAALPQAGARAAPTERPCSTEPAKQQQTHYQLCAARPALEPEPELLGDAELRSLAAVDDEEGRTQFFRTPLGAELGAAIVADDPWAVEAKVNAHALARVPGLLQVLCEVARERYAGKVLRYIEGVGGSPPSPSPSASDTSDISSLADPETTGSRPGSAGWRTGSARERKRRWSKRQLEHRASLEGAAGTTEASPAGGKEDARRAAAAEDSPPLLFAKRSFELQLADVEDGDGVRIMGTPLNPAPAALLLPPRESLVPPSSLQAEADAVAPAAQQAARVCV